MSHLSQDITDWIAKAKNFQGGRAICSEGHERLSPYPSMHAAWRGSTHGPYLAFILRVEGLETEEIKNLHKLHFSRIKVAKKSAEAKGYTGPERLQDLDDEYAEALAAHANAIKALVENPFTT